MPRALIFGIILAGTGLYPADAQKARVSLAYGRHLAQECAGCHSAQTGGGIPVIAGLCAVCSGFRIASAYRFGFPG